MRVQKKHLGVIGLDIDGTITDDRRGLADEVALFLEELHRRGFAIIFITGREFVYAMEVLSKLAFPFYLGVQNGADLLAMPEKRLLKSVYLDKSILLELERQCEKIAEDLLVYAGFEKGDFCYYRPDKHPQELLPYLQAMQKRSAGTWHAVQHFCECPQKVFPLIKAIGKEASFLKLYEHFPLQHLVEYVVIKDPLNQKYDYLLVTDRKASKKHALEYFMQTYDLSRPLIVAGDDLNDKASLEYADIRIVMENAPSSLKNLADIIAPLSIHQGIITGLKQALDKLI
ncbi:MAG: HAD family phosphatase [Chlamydiae bacterium]|nr:HAD family phosphatase [Chlamydiota bacterium]